MKSPLSTSTSTRKQLSLVINDGSDLSDKQIEKLAKRAGYRIAAIRRDSEAMGG